MAGTFSLSEPTIDLLRGALPGHTPVCFALRLEGAAQRVVKFVRPAPIQLAQRDAADQDRLVSCLWDPLEPWRRAALGTADVDFVWEFWTWAAEETLLALSCPDLTPESVAADSPLPAAPSHLPRGRGTDRLLRTVRLCPKQRRSTGAPLTCPQARIQAAQGPLREVLRWLERPHPRPGATPYRVMQAWKSLLSRLRRLRALGPGHSGFHVEGGPDRLAPLGSLRRLRTALASEVQAVQQAADSERLRAWRSSLEEASSTDQGAVYRWPKDESYAPPVTFLSRPDGTATANLGEMDRLLRRYGRHVRRVPMIAS